MKPLLPPGVRNAVFASLFAVFPAVLQAQVLRPDVVFLRNFNGSETKWSVIPFIGSDDGTQAFVSSPSGYFTGSTDGSAGAAGLSSFAELVSEVTGSSWTLTLDPDGAPDDYTFDFSVDTLDESYFSEVLLTQPASLDQVTPGPTSFAWTGPSGTDHIDFIIQKSDYSSMLYEFLSPDATGFTLSSPLDPGEYFLTIRYVTPLSGSEITLAEPIHSGSGDPLSVAAGLSWEPVAYTWSEGSFTFTVIPEPAISLLSALGLSGLLLRRR